MPKLTCIERADDHHLIEKYLAVLGILTVIMLMMDFIWLMFHYYTMHVQWH